MNRKSRPLGSSGLRLERPITSEPAARNDSMAATPMRPLAPATRTSFFISGSSLFACHRNLYGGSAAIDRQNRTLDETGAIARQEHDRLGYLLRRGRTPGRRLRREPLQRVAHCRRAFGAGRSGTDRIHADAL